MKLYKSTNYIYNFTELKNKLSIFDNKKNKKTLTFSCFFFGNINLFYNNVKTRYPDR